MLYHPAISNLYPIGAMSLEDFHQWRRSLDYDLDLWETIKVWQKETLTTRREEGIKKLRNPHTRGEARS